MAVDYEEGRRLLAELRKAEDGKGWEVAASAHSDFAAWFVTHAEALLNPDPWRPISDMSDELRDGRPVLMRGVQGKYHVVAWKRNYHDHYSWCTADRFYSEEYFTHFRELKGPGQ